MAPTNTPNTNTPNTNTPHIYSTPQRPATNLPKHGNVARAPCSGVVARSNFEVRGRFSN
jgi:hypothetical protein